LGGYILYSDRISFRLWQHLEDAIREGSHRWEQEFGFTEGIFNHLFATEKDKVTFLAGMNGHGLLSSPAAVAAFDLGRFYQMVDLGGATGHLVIAAFGATRHCAPQSSISPQ
jgi:acetylserotonin N-methyltransferase